MGVVKVCSDPPRFPSPTDGYVKGTFHEECSLKRKGMGVIEYGAVSSTHQIAQCIPLCGSAATLSPAGQPDYYEEEEKRLSRLFFRLVTADLIGGAMFAPLP